MLSNIYPELLESEFLPMISRYLSSVCTLAILVAPASAQLSSNTKILTPFKSVVAAANESTVRVYCVNKEKVLGTVVFSDGYILTKASELHGAVSVRLNDGTEYDAKIVGKHKDTDLALLHIDATDLKPVVFTDSTTAATGNWLVAATPPKTEPVAVGGVGIVSVKTRKLTGRGPDTEIFNHHKGFLGIMLAETDPKDKDGKVLGAKVISVSKDGAAKKAGIKENDLITAVNENKVLGRAHLQELLDDTRPDETVTVSISRKEDGDEVTEEIQVKLKGEEVPFELKRERMQNSMGSDLSGRRTGFPAILQTDLVIDAKNCGGPIVDLDGKVLGISIARAGRVETWVLPSENIRPLLADLKAGKFAPTTAKAEK
jgi:serine protease Do